MFNKLIRRSSRLFWENVWGVKAFDKRLLSVDNYLNEIASDSKIDGRPKLLISIDDLSMVKDGFFSFDRGGEPHGIFEQIIDVCEDYSWFRPIFFLIPYNVEILDGRNIFRSYSKKRALNHWTNKKRLKIIQTALENNLINIGMHGLMHKQYDYFGYHPYAEFEFSNTKSDLNKIKLMIEYFEVSKLPSFMFKPPAFGIGQSIGKQFCYDLRKNLKVKYVFLSTPNNGLNTLSYKVSHIHPTNIYGMINIPQNVNLSWSYQQIKDVVEAIIQKNGIVHPQFHCVSDKCLDDGWSKDIWDKLEFIQSIMAGSSNGYHLWRPEV